ncbi:MAG TPA: aldo/keto reductase [Armatimonadota bacterium]|nr:aldo/keto reductase [Armatimonadota bacterium]
MDRRTFIKATGGLAAAAALGENAASAATKPLARRTLGKTGQKLSILGFGGIVVSAVEPEEASRLVHEAYDRGVNYFDVAPSYGNAEERLGPALEGLRDKVFLACKAERRDREGAAAQLRQSLRTLRTDHFDLYQLHGLSKMEDLEQAAGPNGALEALTAARQEGLIRWIGFSAHSPEVALAAMDRFDFDTVLFPINFVTWMRNGFGPQVLAKAEEKGMGRLAIKAMACTHWKKDETREYPKCWYRPLTDPAQIALALRFTLSQSVTAAIPPGDARLFRQALDVASHFKPITAAEQKELASLAASTDPIF